MQLERIDVWHVALPLRTPWRTAYGSDPSINSIIVRIISDKGTGWGEATPFAAPTYSPQTAHSTFRNIQDYFIPRILTSKPSTPDEVLDCLSIFKGNTFAKAALETAWWTLLSDVSGDSLKQLLGGTQATVPVGADFQIYDQTELLLEDIAVAIEAGYPRVKLKVAPGKDIDVIRQVRHRFPDLVFHIDCNSGYSLGKHATLFQRMDEFGLAMIEQPLQHDDLLDHSRLQALLATPVCLDESIISERSFVQALDVKACRAINVKPGRVGGLGPAKKIHDLAQKANVTSWVGGMLESGIGVRIALALASLPGFDYPADIFPTDRIHSFDIVSPPIKIDTPAVVDVDEYLTRAMEVDMEALKSITVESYHWAENSRRSR
jgi:o-succinylbenzoate synthase